MENDEFAPNPNDIKKVILITHSGGEIKVFENLLEAVTAVYNLDSDTALALQATLSPKDKK